MPTIFIFIAILVVLIVVHELGHFVAAKLFGVRVEEFGVGYPPRAFLLATKGDTEYTLNWIPFGGFVRLFGDEGDKVQHGRGAYVDAPKYAQAVILVAGVTMNVVIAWAFFAGALTLGIPRVVDTQAPGENAQLMVSEVVPGSPASVAGMASGDQILSMTDAKGVALSPLTPSAVVDFVRARGGQEITIESIHNAATTTTVLRPANGVAPQAAGRPALGIGVVLVAHTALPLVDALKQALPMTWSAVVRTAQSLGELAGQAVRGSVDLRGVVGPVGLVSVVGEAAHTGVGQLFALTAFISVNLAVINLIPIPVLDGGRLFILGIEVILRRPAPRLVIQMLNALGIALIIMLMIAVTYHDIIRLLA